MPAMRKTRIAFGSAGVWRGRGAGVWAEKRNGSLVCSEIHGQVDEKLSAPHTSNLIETAWPKTEVPAKARERISKR